MPDIRSRHELQTLKLLQRNGLSPAVVLLTTISTNGNQIFLKAENFPPGWSQHDCFKDPCLKFIKSQLIPQILPVLLSGAMLFLNNGRRDCKVNIVNAHHINSLIHQSTIPSPIIQPTRETSLKDKPNHIPLQPVMLSRKISQCKPFPWNLNPQLPPISKTSCSY